ncbi:restriction endonuclease subunit S [Laspinema olomoucense]|uniref:restriction endonuclease subunit S n=1 Tax=Laspinema olomoucense TaxID=3231600 RepID=UPI0021BB08EE|nr:restriction endonuclease subunit S [Laspinema sp. D3c]MCT7992741.1 restriction endonuclease subunit S [Laspinema sp. D3c]
MAVLGQAISLSTANYINIEDDKEYRIAGVQNYGKGVVIRRIVRGSELTMKKYQVINKNQLMWCKVDTKNGAFGVTNEQHIGALASTNMALATINDELYLPEFVEALFQLKPFYDWITKYSSGSTNRKYLTPKELLKKVEIPDLTIGEQISFQKKVNFLKQSGFDAELTHQQTLLKKLRQQILQEAIEGKLTADWRSQNPDVEPASKLLKRIATEKAQLIKEKKIKAQKPLPPITDEEKPFELPQGWEWIKIEHFLQYDRRGMITGPFGSALQKSEHQAAGVPVWGIESIRNGRFSHKNKIFVTKNKAVELRSFSAIPGDIIISRSGTIDEVCVIPDGVQSGLISTNLLRVSVLDQVVYPQYFCFLFKGCTHVIEQLKELCSGSTRLFLNQNILKSLLFPVPPVVEQHAIVAKVEKLLALCDQLETQITQNQTHAEQLMQAVLKEAFNHNSESTG